MKNSKSLLLIYVFLLTTFVSFAEDPNSKSNRYSSKYNIGRHRCIGADSGTPDLKHLEFGVRYMPTFSSFDVNTYDGGVVEGSFTMSNGFGAFLGVNFTNHLGVIGEVNYYQATQKYADRNFNNDLTINYLNIPLLLSLNTNKSGAVNLNFVAGPQFGLNVGSKLETSGSNGSDTAKAIVAVRKGDIGFAYGAGLEFALNSSHTFRLDVGYRGFYGLVNMDSSTKQDGTYNVIVSASRKTYGGYIGLAWMF